MLNTFFMLLLLLVIFGQIISWLIYADQSVKDRSVTPGIICTGISIPIIIWFILYVSSTKIIEEEFILPIHTAENSQFIYYDNKMININKKLGRFFQDNDKIKVTHYKEYYYGVTSITPDIYNDYELFEK